MSFRKLISSHIVVFLFSCSNQNTSEVFNQLNTSLISSNEFISSFTQNEYRELTGNLSDPRTVERARKWQPKSIIIQKMTVDILKEIDSIKENLENKIEGPKQFVLFDKINNFRNTILSLDASLNRTFSKDKKLIQSSKESFVDSTFSGKKREEQIMLLTALQNKILMFENRVVTFCKLQTEPGCNLGFDVSTVIVGQNTTHLKFGELLEINAGVGAFRTAGNPTITINSNIIPTLNGVAHFKLRASNKIGKHSIPVKIDYLNQNGEKVSTNNDVEYYVDE